MLTGTANLTDTANSGTDTLVSNSGVDTLVGGSGSDTFVINNKRGRRCAGQLGHGQQLRPLVGELQYVLPTNVIALVLTGTANLTATGNAASDVLTANAGNDTLITGAGVATLVGGVGNDTFVVNNASDRWSPATC